MQIKVKVIVDGQEVSVERDLQNSLQETAEKYVLSKFIRVKAVKEKKKWKARFPFKAWTPVEDGIILAKYAEMKDTHSKSAIIRSVLPELNGRTQVAIYNRMIHLLKPAEQESVLEEV